MANRLLSKYLWIVDTVRRHGRITLEQLNRLWLDTEMSEGAPMIRRTFYNCRQGIEKTLNIRIELDASTYEYYIDTDSDSSAKMQQWLMDSMAMSSMLRESSEVSGRIVLERVPSSNEFLSGVIDAMRQHRRVKFMYKSYSEVTPKKRVVEPYFVKIFKQLWYVVGFNVADRKIKTYSLDRIKSLVVTDTEFEMPADITPYSYFKDCFGIVNTNSEPRDVTLRVSRWLANYFRALPLHESQMEQIHDDYSLFTYRLKVTSDFVQEILRYGGDIEVVAPLELRVRIVEELKKSLSNYGIRP